MTILDFIKLFKGYTFHLFFSHINDDGTLVYDQEYSYQGSTEDFERKKEQYDWLFDIDLTDSDIAKIKVDNYDRACIIEVEQA